MSRTLRIPKPKIFSFEECLKVLDRNELEVLHRVKNGVLFKAFSSGRKLTLTKLSDRGTHLEIDIIGDLNEDVALHYYTDLLDLDRDLGGFYKVLNSHDVFNYMAESFYGLRVIGIPDLFECICWCIIGQQINLTFAYQVKKRLIERYGHSLEHENEVYYHFPSFEVLCDANKEELLAMKFSNNKANYLIGISQEFANGNLSKEMLLPMTYEERIEKLVSFKGIGQWTANYVCMKCFQDSQSIPYGDSGLNAALKAHGFGKTKEEIDQVFEPFEDWKNYLSFYLWRSLSKY